MQRNPGAPPLPGAANHCKRSPGRGRMATPGRGVRSTRKLRQWIVEQVESGKFPGLVWDDPPAKTMFRIPWKHAGKQEFRHEEDAAFFKAWAIFKGKDRPGSRLDPAACKTRIRCALSKSPEFEEVPSRSRLDVTEPYKVYRLVPLSEQRTGNSSKKPRKMKPEASASESSEEGEKNFPGSVSQMPVSLSLPDTDSSSTSGAKTSLSPDTATLVTSQQKEFALRPPPGEPAPVETEIALHLNIETVPAEMPLRTGEFSIHMTIFYSGVLIQNLWLPQGDFRIMSVNAPPGALSTEMYRVVLPRPDKLGDSHKQKATLQLLKDLEKGVMAESNRDGIFVQRQRKCKASVCWQGLAESQTAGQLGNDFLHVFSTKAFWSAWDQHMQGLAPKPEHQVTLCIGQQMGQNDSLANKLIVIQMAQAFAAWMNSKKEKPELNFLSASLMFPDLSA